MIKPEHIINPEKKTVEVTTVQDILTALKWNKSTAGLILNCNRATIDNIINDGRENVVLINDDGSYKLLK